MSNGMMINEIFYSLQGEGERAGQASVFIRASGCDLACSFCDTEFESGTPLSLDSLYERIKDYPSRWITWTGGEPMLQLTEDIVGFFREKGYSQSMETNGGHRVPFDLEWLVVSPKVANHVLRKNFPGGVDELRYAWHHGKLSVPDPGISAKSKFLSPIFDGDTPHPKNIQHCVDLCLSNPEWKLSTQNHKIWKVM